MIKIELTKEQVEELNNFYQHELDKISKRAVVIAEILGKINVKSDNIESTKKIEQKNKTSISAKKIDVNTSAEQKSKKPKWGELILELLNEKQKPLSLKEMLMHFKQQLQLPASELKKVTIAIQQSLQRLRTVNKKITNTRLKGKRGKFYALAASAGLVESTPVIEEKKQAKIRKTSLKKQDKVSEKIVEKRPVVLKEKKIKVEPKSKNLKWRDLIISYLNEQQKALSLKQLLKYFENKFNLSADDLKKAALAIQQSLYRLRTKEHKIVTQKVKGQAGILFGLSDWATTPEPVTATPKTVEPKKIRKSAKANKKAVAVASTPKPKLERKKRTVKESKPLAVKEKANVNPAPGAYNWPDFVSEYLNKTKRVLSSGELLRYAMKHYNIPREQTGNTRNKLAPAITKMELEAKLLKSTKKKGVNGRVYGFTEWFDANGTLKPEFK